MKLLVLGCKTMREGVVVSAIFFIAAICLVLAGQFVVPKIAYLHLIAIAAGMILLLFSPVILISTFLISVLPGAREKLDKCEH